MSELERYLEGHPEIPVLDVQSVDPSLAAAAGYGAMKAAAVVGAAAGAAAGAKHGARGGRRISLGSLNVGHEFVGLRAVAAVGTHGPVYVAKKTKGNVRHMNQSSTIVTVNDGTTSHDLLRLVEA